MFRARLCSKHVEEYNKLIKKTRIGALSWSVTKITVESVYSAVRADSLCKADYASSLKV